MQNYNFLRNLVLVDTGRIRVPKEKVPTEGLVLRIFADGKVYPSGPLMDKFDLEYRMDADGNKLGNGIDVIDSHEWKLFKDYPRMIIFGITPKAYPKVELFATTRANDDGSPKASVLTQGSVSVTLLELVRSMGYLTEEQKYCDLVVVVDHPITTQDGIAFIPKTIERGGKKGERTYERRENITFYPVTTVEMMQEESAAAPAPRAIAMPTDVEN